MTGFDDTYDSAAGRYRPAGLVSMAAAALLLGVLVYLTDRSGSPVALIPRVETLAGHHVFGAIGQWLPSFVHPFAFSLLTVAALPVRAAPRYGVCVAWCAINLVFEVGQHAAIKGPLAAALHDVLGRTPPVRWLANYLVRGTFDVGDMLAAILGALAAAAVFYLVRPRQEQTHAP